MKTLTIYSKKYGQFDILMDDDDFDRLGQYNWSIIKKGCGLFYVRRASSRVNNVQKRTYMHRDILGITDPNIHVDHMDGCGWNNTRQNIRICTKEQNRRNSGKMTTKPTSSKYIGVCATRKKREGRVDYYWRSSLQKKGLGNLQKHFPYTPEGEVMAAREYDRQAVIHYGEFANLNFQSKHLL